MPMIRGTCHFVSRKAAVQYYRNYGLTAADVAAKLAAGEIRIGVPLIVNGERLIRVDDNQRYAIEDIRTHDS